MWRSEDLSDLFRWQELHALIDHDDDAEKSIEERAPRTVDAVEKKESLIPLS